MTDAAPQQAVEGAESGALVLRPSAELRQLPASPSREPASSTAQPRPISSPAAPVVTRLPADPLPATQSNIGLTLLAGGVAAVAALGWITERRRRRLLEAEKDSVFWAHVQPHGSSFITTVGSIDDILPDGPDPAEAARAIYVTSIGETNSRREATLIDLHQLRGKLTRRRDRGDNVAAVLLLQQHLGDFRYTSPWVFLELRELYKLLDRQNEWDIARDAFRKRFGQNAPHWAAPSTQDTELPDDPQLCAELTQYWPFREARMFVLHWMLGEPEMRQKCSGPPLLTLGVYRDLMLIDSILDDVLVVRPAVADSLL